MDEMLNQLGGLVLGAVPTMVLFILLVIAYGFLVRRPLERVLGERRSRTTGAMDEAKAAISKAETGTAEQEERLRKAKAEIFAAREARLKQWATERESALAEVRTGAAAKASAARGELEQSAAAAKQQIESMSADLSEQILRAVMPAAQAGAVQR